MGLPTKGTNKSPKGTVSIAPYRSGLRLRWRYNNARPALYISSSTASYQKIAIVIKGIIERDILTGDYDDSLQRYHDLLQKAVIHDATLEHQILPATFKPETKRSLNRVNTEIDLIPLFNQYLAARGKAEHNLSCYYYDTRQLLKRWGTFPLEEVPQRLNAEKVSNKTFNDRRNCLFQFFEWCVRKQKLPDNPLTDVRNKKRNKAVDQRKPFTEKEARDIIEALQLDLYSKQPTYPHSQYWRFVSFLLHTGARNGEAIGLRIKEVNFESREIRIAYSLSRTKKGTNVAARVLKGTKMENVRSIPMDDYLDSLLEPICKGRSGNEFVFVNRNGNPIDDKMFLRRIFRPLLEELKIDKRDLYACRHTFATRAVQQGMKPHEVAYIMGDSVEVVLQNYFHNNRRPEMLPTSILNTIKDGQTI
ncbi:MAG: site-specific integrase [Chitinophagaceae bacterium]|nr:MAG: site-specific integrase [Chitinophagaceae bacterium]